MSEHGPNGDKSASPLKKWSFANATWAGPGRHANEFCVGLEDGCLALVPHDGTKPAPLRIGPHNTEAVNGVAFINSTCAVSTRAEIVFLTASAPDESKPHGIFPVGAHGVIATSQRTFVAPLGHEGMMNARPVGNVGNAALIARLSNRALNYYKATSVVSRSVTEVIVCAVRKDGIVVAPLDNSGFKEIRVMTLPGLDVVDVCALGPDQETPAVVALGKDGTLAFFRDVLHDAVPTTIQYKTIEGTGYRVLAIQGALFVLTDRYLYFLDGLAERFPRGEFIYDSIQIKKHRCDAIDANTADNRWLFVVVNDGVLRVDVTQFVAAAPTDGVERQFAAPNSPVAAPWKMAEGLPLSTEPVVLIDT